MNTNVFLQLTKSKHCTIFNNLVNIGPYGLFVNILRKNRFEKPDVLRTMGGPEF